MTKYILAGGNDRQTDDYGNRLAIEVYKTVNKPAHILSCFFSSPEPWQWELQAKDRMPWFKEHFGSDIAYDFALLETFVEQVRKSDLVYLHGGDNETLIQYLAKYDSLEEAFTGKVIIGSSAGANYLSTKYWTRGKQKVGQGSGIIPYGVMVHYGSRDGGFNDDHRVDWQEAEERLKEQLPRGMDILRIKEGEFVVVEQ